MTDTPDYRALLVRYMQYVEQGDGTARLPRFYDGVIMDRTGFGWTVDEANALLAVSFEVFPGFEP